MKRNIQDDIDTGLYQSAYEKPRKMPTDEILTQHTPTPWKLAPTIFAQIVEDDMDGAMIADCDIDKGLTPQVEEANAAYIVLAVNSHEELLATAKHLLDLVADFANGDKPPIDIRSRHTDFAQAIAKAEGK